MQRLNRMHIVLSVCVCKRQSIFIYVNLHCELERKERTRETQTERVGRDKINKDSGRQKRWKKRVFGHSFFGPSARTSHNSHWPGLRHCHRGDVSTLCTTNL